MAISGGGSRGPTANSDTPTGRTRAGLPRCGQAAMWRCSSRAPARRSADPGRAQDRWPICRSIPPIRTTGSRSCWRTPPRWPRSPLDDLRARLDGSGVTVIDITTRPSPVGRPRRWRCPRPATWPYDLHLGHHRSPEGVAVTTTTSPNWSRGLHADLPPGRVRCGRSGIRWSVRRIGVGDLGALLHGGRLVVIPESVAGSPERPAQNAGHRR